MGITEKQLLFVTLSLEIIEVYIELFYFFLPKTLLVMFNVKILYLKLNTFWCFDLSAINKRK